MWCEQSQKIEMLKEIPKWGPNFEIIFDLKINSWTGGTSLLRFSSLMGNCCPIGQRIPGIWTSPSKRNHIRFRTHIGKNGNYLKDVKFPGIKKWVKIGIYQVKFHINRILHVIFLYSCLKIFIINIYLLKVLLVLQA